MMTLHNLSLYKIYSRYIYLPGSPNYDIQPRSLNLCKIKFVTPPSRILNSFSLPLSLRPSTPRDGWLPQVHDGREDPVLYTFFYLFFF